MSIINELTASQTALTDIFGSPLMTSIPVRIRAHLEGEEPKGTQSSSSSLRRAPR